MTTTTDTPTRDGEQTEQDAAPRVTLHLPLPLGITGQLMMQAGRFFPEGVIIDDGDDATLTIGSTDEPTWPDTVQPELTRDELSHIIDRLDTNDDAELLGKLEEALESSY